MSWNAKLFNYCERGLDPGFWAEPLNAITNLAFALVAIAMMRRLYAVQAGERPWNRTGLTLRLLLIALVALISVGSFGFHTLATRWARMGDVVPIGLFMIAYLVFALRHFVRAGAGAIAVALGVFAAVGFLAGRLTGADGMPVFNGTVAYVPALLALLAVGVALAQRDEPDLREKSRLLLLAGGIFSVSMVFRTIDLTICDRTAIADHAVGTHFLWHLLNALTLYLLLRAAIEPDRGTISI